jgi:hypothetical protein
MTETAKGVSEAKPACVEKDKRPATLQMIPLKEIAAISSLLSLGVMLVYFWRIGYVPIDGLADVAAVGGIALLSCALLVLVLLALWSTPSLLQWGLVSDTSSRSELQWFMVGGDAAGESKPRADLKKCLRFSAASVGVGWFFLTIVFAGVGMSLEVPPHSYEFFALLLLVLACVMLKKLLLAKPEGKNRLPWYHLVIRFVIRFFVIVLFATAALMPLYAALLILQFSAVGSVREDWMYAIFAVLASGVVAVLTSAFGLWLMLDSAGTRAAWVAPLAINAAALAFAVTLSGAFLPFLDAAMTLASIRVRNATLVLKAQTCESLRLLGIRVSGTLSTHAESSGPCLLSNVTVSSRIGQRWRIDCEIVATGIGSSAKLGGFTVPAAGIEAWHDAPPSRSVPPSEQRQQDSICSSRTNEPRLVKP